MARGKRKVADWFSRERFLAEREDSWVGAKKFEVTEQVGRNRGRDRRRLS